MTQYKFNQIVNLTKIPTFEDLASSDYEQTFYCINAKVYFNDNTVVITGLGIDAVYIRREVRRFEMRAV